MKFTFNGKEYYADAVETENNGIYVFTFKNIAPQCMGDNIKAELIIGGKVVATKEEYSILENVTSEAVMNDNTRQLIYDLLAYGAAAQKYAGYKTDALVNAGYEDLATVVESVENSDRYVSAPLSDARFTAMGVYFSNTNKIYAKISADNISGVIAKINGKEAVIEQYVDGSYIVYSEDIKVADFDKVYTFTIETAAGTQTLKYSVNAWCAVKYDSESERGTAELAKALYAYGVSAEEYISIINAEDLYGNHGGNSEDDVFKY